MMRERCSFYIVARTANNPNTYMNELNSNYQNVITRLKHACQNNSRPAHSVKLLAVSKTKPASVVEQAYQLGQRSFGENYLQDGLEKINALSHLSDIEWHFIGPLQSNKTRAVAEHFDWLETLDRERIAKRLNEQRPTHKKPLNVLLQINISREPQKSGLMPEEVLEFAQRLGEFTNLSLRGLMCIAEANIDESALSAQFQQMHNLFKQLQAAHPQVDTLSMGMSADMDIAIACGSTEIRIGTDIFGAREYNA